MKFKIDTEGLNIAYRQIKESNYRLKRVICGGPKQNKEKSVVASVTAEHFLEYALLTVNFFFENSNLNKEIPICKCDPGYFIYSRLFSNTKWDDNSHFRLSSKTKEINAIVNVNGDLSILYYPIEREIEDIKKEINFLTQEVYFQL